MSIIDDLLATLRQDAPLHDIRVGAFWTAVVVNRVGRPRCGLASTLRQENHRHHGRSPVQEAGHLLKHSALELAALARSQSLLEASIGLAAINSLLDVDEDACVELNAEQVILERGRGKRVVIVGHFPFVRWVRQEVGKLWVLEKRPREDDLPAEKAVEVIPQADVVAITGTTLINRTFEGLMNLCRPDAFVLVLGPTTPLSPVLFDYGVDVLCGTVVDDVEAVLRAVSQGATFRQIHHCGARLLTMQRPIGGGMNLGN